MYMLKAINKGLTLVLILLGMMISFDSSSQQLTLSGLSRLDKQYLSDSIVTMVAEATIEGHAAVKELIIARADIVDYKLQVRDFEKAISLHEGILEQKDEQLVSLQEQYALKEEQYNNATQRIAQLRLKNGLIIGIGVTVAVGAAVAAVYYGMK